MSWVGERLATAQNFLVRKDTSANNGLVYPKELKDKAVAPFFERIHLRERANELANQGNEVRITVHAPKSEEEDENDLLVASLRWVPKGSQVDLNDTYAFGVREVWINLSLNANIEDDSSRVIAYSCPSQNDQLDTMDVQAKWGANYGLQVAISRAKPTGEGVFPAASLA